MNSASVPLADPTSRLRAASSVPTLSPAERATPTPPTTDAGAWPVSIFGVPFDNVTVTETLRRVDTMIASRQPHYIVTANVDFLVQAHQDVELRRILLEADLVLCDGTPLLWASRWLGNSLPERVAGSDLAPSLIRNATEKKQRIFLLGAAPGVAAEATARLERDFPGIHIAGHYAPPFSALLEMDHAEIVRRIRDAKPDILLVSFGCPKQEKWIAMHYRSLGVPVSIGVGATIDFLAGRVKRAPDWMRHSGTEWIYRLLQEPRRLYRRYAKDLACFGPTFARHWLHLSPRPKAGTARRAPITAGDWSHLDAGEALTLAALKSDADFWRNASENTGRYLLDVSTVRHVDATGIAFLVRWRKRLQSRGGLLVLLAPSAPLRRALAALQLEDYFFYAANATEAMQRIATSATQPTVLHDSEARSLVWCGEIVAGNTEEVWQRTTTLLETFVAGGTKLVIIDLSRLRFIDSAGAGLMLRIKKWAQQFPAEVLFTHAQPNVHNVLRLTRLDHVLLDGAQ